jgi:hypothetical protein
VVQIEHKLEEGVRLRRRRILSRHRPVEHGDFIVLCPVWLLVADAEANAVANADADTDAADLGVLATLSPTPLLVPALPPRVGLLLPPWPPSFWL